MTSDLANLSECVYIRLMRLDDDLSVYRYCHLSLDGVMAARGMYSVFREARGVYSAFKK